MGFQLSLLTALQGITCRKKKVACVRFHTAVRKPGRVSCRRRHTGVWNVKTAEEVSSRKEHSIPNVTIFHRVHSCLRSSHIPSVWTVDAAPRCLMLGDILAPVPLSPAHSVKKLLHHSMPAFNGSIRVCYGPIACPYSLVWISPRASILPHW